MAESPLRFAAIGLDHRHIYHQVGRLLELGCECAGFWTDGDPQPLGGFLERFEVRAMTRAAELVGAGAIGEVVHLTGFGPHRLNRHLRPPLP